MRNKHREAMAAELQQAREEGIHDELHRPECMMIYSSQDPLGGWLGLAYHSGRKLAREHPEVCQ